MHISREVLALFSPALLGLRTAFVENGVLIQNYGLWMVGCRGSCVCSSKFGVCFLLFTIKKTVQCLFLVQLISSLLHTAFSPQAEVDILLWEVFYLIHGVLGADDLLFARIWLLKVIS